MPYSGGSSTQSGIAYQNWYLALLISHAFFEVDYVIYPEALKSDKTIVDDIKVKTRLGKIMHSVKFRSPSKKLHWEQSNLFSQGVFSDFKKQHEADPECTIVLVSENNCYLFSEVFMRARNAELPNDIYTVLVSEYAIEQWEMAKKYLGYDDFQLIAFAKKIEMKCIPLIEIKDLIKHRFINMGCHNEVKNLFYHKAGECSSNKTKIDKTEINRWLDEDMIDFNK
ncbi:hypothetical protein I215_09516 [Galbibacter marinus]|uniref:Uncharacterized protein n=1 Tax=Galbibacter marinus TaxID=555500 RepID=K2P1P4_9FLAO|nr:hypothetical protein [Galbibacter marinus]EKF54948.1 hypothetical protein I215_09516 [Galbibacter marinus]